MCPVGLFDKMIFYQTFAVHFPWTQACYPLQPICLRTFNIWVSLAQVGNQYVLLECCCTGLHLNSHLCIEKQDEEEKRNLLLRLSVFLTWVVRYDDRIILPVSYNHLYLPGQDQQKAPKKILYSQYLFLMSVFIFFRH